MREWVLVKGGIPAGPLPDWPASDLRARARAPTGLTGFRHLELGLAG